VPPKRRATTSGATPRKQPNAKGPSQTELRAELAQQRSLEALNLMRARGYSLAKAAREAGVGARTVLRRVGSALTAGPDGRYAATAWDRLPRTMRFLTPRGLANVTVTDSRLASHLAAYMSAVHRYLDTGDRRALAAFRGQAFVGPKAKYAFITDPKTLERLAYAGEVSFEDIYAMTTGETK
jgi:hypothetical protein